MARYPTYSSFIGVIYSGDSSSDIVEFVCSKKKNWLEEFFIDDVVFHGIFPQEYGYTLIHSTNLRPQDGEECACPCYLIHIHSRSETHMEEKELAEKMQLMFGLGAILG